MVAMVDESLILGGLQALVVDDDDDARSLLTFLLELHGVEVIAADSAKAALAALQENQPDVMVCDIAMPQEDGYMLIQQIRALEAGQATRLPVIALSALSPEEGLRPDSAEEFQAYLTKPVEPEQLVAAILESVKPPKYPAISSAYESN